MAVGPAGVMDWEEIRAGLALYKTGQGQYNEKKNKQTNNKTNRNGIKCNRLSCILQMEVIRGKEKSGKALGVFYINL